MYLKTCVCSGRKFPIEMKTSSNDLREAKIQSCSFLSRVSNWKEEETREKNIFVSPTELHKLLASL